MKAKKIISVCFVSLLALINITGLVWLLVENDLDICVMFNAMQQEITSILLGIFTIVLCLCDCSEKPIRIAYTVAMSLVVGFNVFALIMCGWFPKSEEVDWIYYIVTVEQSAMPVLYAYFIHEAIND